jgi:predicted transcriptional regulator of viral defense system
MFSQAHKRLYSLAEAHEGFFTTQEAQAIGFAPAHIVNLAVRGQIERRSRGVYRLPLYPRGRHEQFQEAILWPQTHRRLQYSLISHTSALELYGISDVSPAKIHVSIPSQTRIRRKAPAWLLLHHAKFTSAEITEHEGIPVTSPFRSILDSSEMNIGPAILTGAVQDAFKPGLISKREYDTLNRRLDLNLPKAPHYA